MIQGFLLIQDRKQFGEVRQRIGHGFGGALRHVGGGHLDQGTVRRKGQSFRHDALGVSEDRELNLVAHGSTSTSW